MAAEETAIFGDKKFGFELADIIAARYLVAKNAQVQAEMLVDEDERVRRVAQRDKESAEREVTFFEAHDDETILDGLRYIFERGKELEATGLPVLEVAATVRSEIPNFSTVSGILLERQSWGYSLNQQSVAAALTSNEQK